MKRRSQCIIYIVKNSRSNYFSDWLKRVHYFGKWRGSCASVFLSSFQFSIFAIFVYWIFVRRWLHCKSNLLKCILCFSGSIIMWLWNYIPWQLELQRDVEEKLNICWLDSVLLLSDEPELQYKSYENFLILLLRVNSPLWKYIIYPIPIL